ncbi:hypothetical protein CXB49_01115 [Chromobacterium sp. ATCC 53434]|uniref:hypothetical protein n=1 Tax=Chromobacterium sp. (strain ATCC 53434 / SC 14030) TaxID=2059672 RepID=UPI000C76E6B8|nr:hypothetical protein [Chromobacterium sp. ATCC 53434]AUH49536.1 hypothetical protein CXB49_01115 [Chromobacterium sp. ATCC 53434]
MLPDLADWFAELPQAQPEATAAPADRATAAELAGALLPAAEGLPLLCRACRACDGQRCGEHRQPASLGLAGHCQSFQLRDGVALGKVWLWRIDLNDRRRVWHMATPPRTGQQVAKWARAAYGDRVLSIQPLPGFDAVPAKLEG